MILNDIKQYKLPDSPGVYFFKQGKVILYIGKATSLSDRVKSYFNKDIISARGPKILKMLELADRVEWQETDSVLEALILEASLIKKHKPLYNTREKDDKSFWQVIITKEAFPRVLLVRGKDLTIEIDPETIKYTFGPFPHGMELKEALKIVRKIFPFRDKCLPAQVFPQKKLGRVNSPRSCFNRQIGLCPGVCSGEISQKDYSKIIAHIKLFFDGKKGKLIASLNKEMQTLAKKREFEKAGKIRNQIFALNHIQDIALLKNKSANTQTGFKIEAYDIAHTQGVETVGALIVLIGGEYDKSAYRKFQLKGQAKSRPDDTANLLEILQRRFQHLEWRLPDLIVIDGGPAQINVARKFIASLDLPQSPKIVAVTKDEHHRAKNIIGETEMIKQYPNEILMANQEVHRFALAFHRKRRDRMVK
jgi:excinuclease ABC subunit C